MHATASPIEVQGSRKVQIFTKTRLLYVAMTLPLVALLWFITAQPVTVLPRISLAPGFLFTDQAGNPLTNEDLRGQLVLYTFTYTQCQEPCPDTGRTLKAVQSRLGEVDLGGLPVSLVSISFDPQRDTPQALTRYAQSLDADLGNWHFVTGDPLRLKHVIGGGFHTFYEQQQDGSFIFDPGFVLVDGWGMIRAEYRSASPSVDVILEDLVYIAQEVANSSGAGRYAYEAAHLFLCYPRR